MPSPSKTVPGSSNSRSPNDDSSKNGMADTDSKSPKSGKSIEGDSTSTIILSIVGTLFFVALVSGGIIYRKYSRNKLKHELLQETGLQLENRSNRQGRQGFDVSNNVECVNPLDREETNSDKTLMWRTHETDEGHKYYENTETGRTTWTARDSSGVALIT